MNIGIEKNNRKTKKGFTLVEALLYVSIISALILMMSSFLYLILNSRTKSQAILEVESQGEFVMNQITQAIRNSDSISVPLQGLSGQLLTLSNLDSSKNPTVINLSDGNIQIKEGVSPITSLTSSQVIISDILFRNISKGNSPGAIRIEFTVSYNSDSFGAEFNYSRKFYGSASIR